MNALIEATLTRPEEMIPAFFTAPPAPVAAGHDEARQPIADVVNELSRAIESDAALVVWHDAPRLPVILYETLDCAPGDLTAQAALVEAAAVAARAHPAVFRTEWSDFGADEAALLTASIPAGGGVITVTSLFRSLGEGTVARAREVSTRFLPLLHPFFRLWSARRDSVARARGLTEAVDKSDVGILLVDRRGRLSFANAAAQALIERGDGLRCKGAMLSGSRLADTLRLHAAIEHVLEAPEGQGRSASPVVALSRRDRRSLMAAVVAGSTVDTGDGDAAAIVYVFDPEQDLRALVEPACKHYGLSPVETRLTCLLADGASLADAAVRIRVREQTARSYLKQIFLKTQTNRQAELVWLMLKSCVRTAPACHSALV